MPTFGKRWAGSSLRTPPGLGQGLAPCPNAGPRPARLGRRHHLGAAASEGQAIVQTGAVATTTALTVAGAMSVIPLVGIGAAIVTLLLKFLGHGCGAACTVTAQLHQIVDAVIDNIIRVANAGLISGPEASMALQSFQNTADQIEEQAAQYPKQVAASIQQFTADIGNGVSEMEALPATPSQAWSLSAAQALYVGHGTGTGELAACGPHTWYCASIAQADSLTNQILQAIVAGRTSTPTQAVAAVGSGIEAEAESAGILSSTGGLTNLGWIVIAAIGGGLLLWKSGSGKAN